jgi:hypothetical protein
MSSNNKSAEAAALRQAVQLEPLAVSPLQATQLVPIGKTKLYEALNSGAIESTVVNGRRWVNFRSLKRFAGVGE